ncbi:hypothetical protein [Palleronia sp.]|uniref:hypothetical protein n=1 Tax=Palleronia sp. TaxID=1940284 RepID=UPI0035C80E1B
MKMRSLGAISLALTLVAGCVQSPDQPVNPDPYSEENRMASLTNAEELAVAEKYTPVDAVYVFPSEVASVFAYPTSSVTVDRVENVVKVKDMQALRDKTAVMGVTLYDGTRYVVGNPAVLEELQ